jgi:hypothetical protein
MVVLVSASPFQFKNCRRPLCLRLKELATQGAPAQFGCRDTGLDGEFALTELKRALFPLPKAQRREKALVVERTARFNILLRQTDSITLKRQLISRYSQFFVIGSHSRT